MSKLDTLTALASENLNPSLRSLLEDVQRGHIRVPRFQRPFVWTNEQRIELLESIGDNMPIGSLLVWRTVKYRLESFPNVGPHIMPAIPTKSPQTGWQYLLDGNQRVSTLLGLLLPPLKEVKETDPSTTEIDWDIQYDLMDEQFVFAQKVRRKGVTRPLLPLWTLFDGRLVNRHLRDLRKVAGNNGWSEDEVEEWETRADQLSYRFQQCRIPIVVMVTDDLGLAAKTFQRINSKGTPMSEAHLVAALTWTSEFDLRDSLLALRDELPFGWRSIDDSIYLQICKGLANLDMTKAGQEELVRFIKNDPEMLDRAGQGLSAAIELLSEQCNVIQYELLPYAYQLVLLAVEFASDRIKRQESRFVDWFWRTGWSELFSSTTYRQMTSEQAYLRGIASMEARWYRDPLPDRFDFRSARVRLFTLRLAQREITNVAGKRISGRWLLEQYGRESLGRLFGAPKDASVRLKQLLQGNGNRFFMVPSEQSEIIEALFYDEQIPQKFLDSYFIDRRALSLLREGDLEAFLQRRASKIEAWDKSEWVSTRDAL
jgi:hypothetical protein